MMNTSGSNSRVVVKANLNDDIQCQEILELLDINMKDIMGGGENLSEYTRANLTRELRSRPSSHVFIVYILDHETAVTQMRKQAWEENIGWDATLNQTQITNIIDQ